MTRAGGGAGAAITRTLIVPRTSRSLLLRGRMVFLTLCEGERARIPGRRRTSCNPCASNHAVLEDGYCCAKPPCLHPVKLPRHLDLRPQRVAVPHVLSRPARFMMVREQGFRQWREKENTASGTPSCISNAFYKSEFQVQFRIHQQSIHIMSL